MSIFYLSTHRPDPNKGGGYHRTYQIHHELIEAFGADAVHMPHPPPYSKKNSKFWGLLNSLRQRSKFIQLVLRRGAYPKFLLDEILDQNSLRYSLFKQISIQNYTFYLKKHGIPHICIVDNTRFLPIINYNLEHHIPTFFCPQNMDSLDLSAHLLHEKQFRKQCGISLIYELEALTQSTLPLLISKMEISIMDGLGIHSDYYPYLPVGEIKQRLLSIRSDRQKNGFDSNLFLMVASVNHTTTYESFKWFFRNALEFGLPPEVQIIVGGRNSDALGNEFPPIPGVKFLGQLEQNVLDDLLRRACAVLIPQMSGFGAVTRIPEMACAGIPIIVSQHAMNAINEPPGVLVAKNDLMEWVDRINEIKSRNTTIPILAYDAWEAEQPKPLIELIKKNLENYR